MSLTDYETFKDAVLYSFKKRKTSFLMTDKILADIHFQKAVNPKEDKERLDAILEIMRDHDWVVLNQPKFVALSAAGKTAVESLTEAQVLAIEKGARERSQ
ncbi:MAG TPA: hypothetical protein VN963_00220 [bacterium]|jgi:hypothetical protein|nr:hypothetical protein [bacterium]